MGIPQTILHFLLGFSRKIITIQLARSTGLHGPEIQRICDGQARVARIDPQASENAAENHIRIYLYVYSCIFMQLYLYVYFVILCILYI